MEQFPDDGHHMMHYAGVRSGYHEFLCETCGRHVLIHSNPARVEEGDHTFVVLKRGAFWAFHSGESAGLADHDCETGHVQADAPPGCPSNAFGAGSGQGPDEEWAELSDDELTEEWKTWLVEILDDLL